MNIYCGLQQRFLLPFISSPVFVSTPASTLAFVCDVGGEVVGGDDSQLYKLNFLLCPSFLPSANVVALGGFLIVVGGDESESVSDS